MKSVMRLFVTMLVLLGFSGAGMAGGVPSLNKQPVKGPVSIPKNIPAIPDLRCVAYALWNDGSIDHKINNGDKFSTTWGSLAGMYTKYFVSAENYGTTAKAENFVLKSTITRDGVVINQTSETISSLEAGKGIKFTIPIPMVVDKQYHQYKIVSVVDATNVVLETNENNNTCTFNFTAQVQLQN